MYDPRHFAESKWEGQFTGGVYLYALKPAISQNI